MKGYTIIISDINYTNTKKLKINYVNAIGSVDDIDVVLTDTAGNPIWVGNTEVTDARYLFGCLNGQEVNGLKLTRFDNCETLIIGVAEEIT